VNPAWHLYPIRLKSEELSADREKVFRALRAENIGVNVHYMPVHLQPYYRDRFGYKGGEYPRAEEAYANLISLPMFHGMSDEDGEDVVRGVTKVLAALLSVNKLEYGTRRILRESLSAPELGPAF
jgi:dTDP-4-amino-4,6-dideoxygalactose transaminase